MIIIMLANKRIVMKIICTITEIKASNYLDVLSGVPQGTVLGLVTFLFYIMMSKTTLCDL